MSKRGQTLVATLIVIAIMAVLAVVLLRGSGAFSSGPAQSSRPDGKGTTIVGAVKYEAQDEVCKSNLKQVKMALDIINPAGDTPAQTLQEAKLPQEFYKCPVGGEPYAYDPATGRASCPHPGHESY